MAGDESHGLVAIVAEPAAPLQPVRRGCPLVSGQAAQVAQHHHVRSRLRHPVRAGFAAGQVDPRLACPLGQDGDLQALAGINALEIAGHQVLVGPVGDEPSAAVDDDLQRQSPPLARSQRQAMEKLGAA